MANESAGCVDLSSETLGVSPAASVNAARRRYRRAFPAEARFAAVCEWLCKVAFTVRSARDVSGSSGRSVMTNGSAMVTSSLSAQEYPVPDADVPIADRGQPIPGGRFGEGWRRSCRTPWECTACVELLGHRFQTSWAWDGSARQWQFFRPGDDLVGDVEAAAEKGPRHVSRPAEPLTRDLGLVVDAVEIQPDPLSAIAFRQVRFRCDTTNCSGRTSRKPGTGFRRRTDRGLPPSSDRTSIPFREQWPSAKPRRHTRRSRWRLHRQRRTPLHEFPRGNQIPGAVAVRRRSDRRRRRRIALSVDFKFRQGYSVGRAAAP